MSIYKKIKRQICIMLTAFFALTFTPGIALSALAGVDPGWNILITNQFIDENDAVGTPVGDFYIETPIGGKTYTFTLIEGYGDDSSFNIVNDTLVSAEVFNYEVKKTYNIRVQVSDGTDHSYQDFAITVADKYEAPTDILLSANTVQENETALPKEVGTLSVVDDDNELPYIYELVDGAGDTDNARFEIDGDTLMATGAFDYETQKTASIRVKVTEHYNDHGIITTFTFEKALTIDITNVNEAPVVNNSSKNAEKNETLSFAAADFTNNYNDPESDELTGIKIDTLPSAAFGTLKMDNGGTMTDITAGQEIEAADIGKIKFVPVALKVGAASFTWQACDGDLWSANTALLTIFILDTKAPLWTPGYPSITNVTPSSAKLNVSINEKGTVYFVALPKGSPAPTSAQTKAGQNAAGIAAAAGMKGSINVEASTSGVMDLKGLVSSTEYDVYFVAEDIYSNIQAQPVKLSVKTLDLVIKGTVVDNGTRLPVQGAVVEINKDFDNDGTVDFTAKVVTAADGTYSIVVPEDLNQYDLKVTGTVNVGGNSFTAAFAQKCVLGSADANPTGIYMADNTSAGLILIKDIKGNPIMIGDYSNYSIDIVNSDGSASGLTGTVSNSGSGKGTFQISGVPLNNTYKVLISYDLGGGKKLVIAKADVKVTANGQISITSVVVDPFGNITDKTTGKAIEGVKVTLYYANTARNIAAGRVPGTVAALPAVSDLAPANNTNPQLSSSLGQYSYLVFPNADYYIVATKDGYQKYTSETIVVGTELVKKDIQMSVVPLVKTGSPLDVQSLGLLGLGSIAAGLGLLRKKEE